MLPESGVTQNPLAGPKVSSSFESMNHGPENSGGELSCAKGINPVFTSVPTN